MKVYIPYTGFIRSKLLLSTLALCLSGFVFAQTAFSNLSRNGFGDRSHTDHGVFSALGQCKISYFDSTVLNFYNPSTYHHLSKGMPLYSFALNGRFTQLTDIADTSWNINVIPDHFAMAFGLNKYFGFAFGLRSFSKAQYEITQPLKVGNDSLKYVYKGSGGSQEVFLGCSAGLIQTKSTRLSVGGNVGYLFGTIRREHQSFLSSGANIIGGMKWSELKMKTLHYEYAATFMQRISEQQSLTVTAVFEPAQRLKAESNTYLFYGNVNNPFSEGTDTLSIITNVKTTLRMMGKSQWGLVYKFNFKDDRNNNSTRKSELALHVNYTHAKFNSDTLEKYIVNQLTGWNFGVQYTPEIGLNALSSQIKFFEKLHYRAGFFRSSMPYRFNGSTLWDRGFTFGFGMPVTSFRTLSSINVAFTAGERSNVSVTSYKERYLGLSFGVILAPSNFDKWFVKRKLD